MSASAAADNAREGRVGLTLKAARADSFSAIVEKLPAETRLYMPKVPATVARRESIQDRAALPAPSGAQKQ